ncbi:MULTISPECIES: TetR/AcrR family transcriptional regulator [unclassified Streptomyces]|uniref:TetR/AcrR family transcriptional regulator n=1 Tax=unclassified Streptomyces TaxID=2593676 RepID=UPI000DB93BC2|nr:MULTISPECIES: TetR/AcrR family transcriptional regulator [unclassified Streptomyces]MYT73008.1 TetR family transcriptional regulator [Streptomyces sp. SID8367]RAJ73804.1 TetR family transcriptional regulator [Streptomyces sp. PsTaAH-137]
MADDGDGHGGLGLRERKKRQTAIKVWRTAADLFLEHGYDEVSVAQIAEAADVSKMTVFNYFKTKEDLLMGPMEEHVEDLARAIGERSPGSSAVDAARAMVLRKIADRDPSVGLSEQGNELALIQLIHRTPALARRALLWAVRGERAAAEALTAETGDSLLSAVAAAQLSGVVSALISDNHRRILAGESPGEVAADAAERAERAFALVDNGLSGFAVRA